MEADSDLESGRDARLAARRQAMDLLARREHARAELAAKLKKRDHDAETVEGVLDTLIDDGLLSNARYARAVVAAKSARGIGPVRIRAELAALDVADAEIESAIDEAEIDWSALAESARVKRFGAALPDDFPARAKQMRFLQRRGFDADQLRAAFDD